MLGRRDDVRDLDDVRVGQDLRLDPCLVEEPLPRLGHLPVARIEDLDRVQRVEVTMPRAVHAGHAAGPELRFDRVVADLRGQRLGRARRQRHLGRDHRARGLRFQHRLVDHPRHHGRTVPRGGRPDEHRDHHDASRRPGDRRAVEPVREQRDQREHDHEHQRDAAADERDELLGAVPGSRDQAVDRDGQDDQAARHRDDAGDDGEEDHQPPQRWPPPRERREREERHHDQQGAGPAVDGRLDVAVAVADLWQGQATEERAGRRKRGEPREDVAAKRTGHARASRSGHATRVRRRDRTSPT